MSKQVLTKEQIYAGLASLDEQHTFYQAVRALIAGDVDDETDAAVAPELADGARQFNAGRLAHARDFQRAFEGSVRDAHDYVKARVAPQRDQRNAEPR